MATSLIHTLQLSMSQRTGQYYGATYNMAFMELNIRFPDNQQAKCLERHIGGRTHPRTNIPVFPGSTVRLHVSDPCKVSIVLPLNRVKEMESNARGLILVFDTPQNADLWRTYLPLCTTIHNQPNPSVPSNRLFIPYNWTSQQLVQALPGLAQSSGPTWPFKAIAYH